jgi:hypothetical protein
MHAGWPTHHSATLHPITNIASSKLRHLMLVLVLTLIVMAAALAQARVLEQRDREIVAQVRTSFASLKNIMLDMAQSLSRLDRSSGDSECLDSALGELQQMAQELAGYEYLLRIENEMPDFDDDNTIKGILRFAVENTIRILESEDKRLNQILADRCARFPLSAGKTQQAVQVIATIATILKSVRPRLS